MPRRSPIFRNTPGHQADANLATLPRHASPSPATGGGHCLHRPPRGAQPPWVISMCCRCYPKHVSHGSDPFVERYPGHCEPRDPCDCDQCLGNQCPGCGLYYRFCRCGGRDPFARNPERRDLSSRGLDIADLHGVSVPNPPPPQVRPVTIALDLIEVEHQAGSYGGITKVSQETWASIFYRGESSSANRAAKTRAFERWKSAVRAFGFECSSKERGDAGPGTFCINMSRAIPWAERVLEESERRAEERRGKTSPTRVANAGGPLVRVRR